MKLFSKKIFSKESLFKLLPIDQSERENDHLVIFSTMLLIVLFLVFISAVSFFILFDDVLINLGNIVVLPFIGYFYLTTKKGKDVPRASLLLLSFVYLVLLGNIYALGLGINVIDVIWFTIVIIAAILFVNIKWGGYFLLLTIFFFIVFMIDEKHERYLYAETPFVPDSNYNFISFISFACLLCANIISFVYIINNLQEKNRKLSEYRINELDHLVKERTLEIENMKKKIAMDFHDEMGNKLASIVSLTDIITLKMNTDPAVVDSYLKNIRRKSQELYTGTKDFLWTINTSDNTVHGLYEYLNYLGQDFFTEIDIEFQAINKIDNKHDYSLSSTEMFNLIMIIKESMSNISKYAEAKNVNFVMNKTDSAFEFEISDNGKGFLVDQAKSGMGLKNMKERSEKINARVIVSSILENGTTVKISLFNLKRV